MDQPANPTESPASPTPTPARRGLNPHPRQIHGAGGGSRVFRSGEEEWAVRESGSTASGRGTDTRVLLVLLFFASGAEPDRPIREILIPEQRLDELTDQELIVLLERALPSRTDQNRKEVFPDTRKKGGGGL